MTHAVDDLLEIMAKLRHPEEGCPWDLVQSYRSIARHTIEEAYEVAEAIEAADMEALKEELGDLLFQVVFYAQLATEDGAFDFSAVVDSLCDKMIRRHPHVFGNASVETADAQIRAWEAHKANERYLKADTGKKGSVIDGVSLALPAVTRAVKLQKRAARVGFDWPSFEPVLEKIGEEFEELRTETFEGADPLRIEAEIGDLLFTATNLARHLDVDPETALRKANRRFEKRFRRMETLLGSRGKSFEHAALDEMEECWRIAKAEEKLKEHD